MAILFPIEDQSYELRWIWNPLDELKGATRYVQWAGQSEYEQVEQNTWEVEEQRPVTVPTRHYKFRIRLSEKLLDRLPLETPTLEVLLHQIRKE